MNGNKVVFSGGSFDSAVGSSPHAANLKGSPGRADPGG